MKTLLVAINAKYIHSNLAVYSLKAYAKELKKDIVIKEYTINNFVEDIFNDIYKEKADVVAFSCYIWNIDMVLEIIPELKKVAPHISIWVGGPEVSYDVDKVLSINPSIDVVMYGEGEETFYKTLSVFTNNGEKDLYSELKKINGIGYRDYIREVAINQPAGQMDMNTLPFVYEDMSLFQNKIIYYETSRGCPFSCSYCLSSIDKRVRFREFNLVKKELKYFIDQKVAQVKFVDRTFNCNKKHAMEIWSFIHENDNGITNFHFEIAADLINEEELLLFSKMRPGLIQLEIGVQSTNDLTINEIDRTMKLDKLTQVVNRINEMKNIHQHLDLIVGLPYEDYDTFKQSFNDVHALNPNQLQLGFLKVLKGSKMHDKCDEYGIEYRSHSPYEVLSTNWINFDQVIELKGVEEALETYYNSNQFVYSLKYLLHFWETPFDFYYDMSKYFDKHKFIGIKHSRISLYDILLDFSMNNKDVDIDVLKQLMIYDLYLREKLKKRPEWANNLNKYKKEYNEFYKNTDIAAKYIKEKDYDSKLASKIMHIEPFSIDIVETANEGKKIPSKQHILFDYSSRNPLNNDARTLTIKELV